MGVHCTQARYRRFSRAMVWSPVAVRPIAIPRCSTRPSRWRRLTSLSETVPARMPPALAIWINAIASCGLNSTSGLCSNRRSRIAADLQAPMIGREVATACQRAVARAPWIAMEDLRKRRSTAVGASPPFNRRGRRPCNSDASMNKYRCWPREPAVACSGTAHIIAESHNLSPANRRACGTLSINPQPSQR